MYVVGLKKILPLLTLVILLSTVAQAQVQIISPQNGTMFATNATIPINATVQTLETIGLVNATVYNSSNNVVVGYDNITLVNVSNYWINDTTFLSSPDNQTTIKLK